LEKEGLPSQKKKGQKNRREGRPFRNSSPLRLHGKKGLSYSKTHRRGKLEEIFVRTEK